MTRYIHTSVFSVNMFRFSCFKKNIKLIQEDGGFQLYVNPLNEPPLCPVVSLSTGKKIEKLDTDDLDEIEKIAS